MYISGNALVILGGPHKLLQTIYVDDTDTLEAVTVDEASGKIAVCGGPDVFIYQPYGIQHETLKVRIPCRVAGGNNPTCPAKECELRMRFWRAIKLTVLIPTVVLGPYLSQRR